MPRWESTGWRHRISFAVLESNYAPAMGNKAGRVGRSAQQILENQLFNLV